MVHSSNLSIFIAYGAIMVAPRSAPPELGRVGPDTVQNDGLIRATAIMAFFAPIRLLSL
jgi:hypothetical protein